MDGVFDFPRTVDEDTSVEYDLGGSRHGWMSQAHTHHYRPTAIGERPLTYSSSRAKVDLIVEAPEPEFQRMYALVAVSTSPFQKRNWSDRAAHCMIPDRYVLAVAERA